VISKAPMPAPTGLDLGVVVPLFNKRATVARAIDALLNQTESPRRIVVVDDGSTDDSLGALAGVSDRVTVVRQTNAGPSAARNRGLQELDTEWVAFADADNCWHRDRVAEINSVIRAHPTLDWLTGRYVRCHPDGKSEIMPPIPWTGEDRSGVVDYFEWTAPDLPGVHASETLVARRSLLSSVGGFLGDLRCHEITLMYLTLAVRNSRVGVVGTPTVDIEFDRPDSLYSSLRESAATMLCFAKALVRLSDSAGAAQRALLRGKAADALHTALWLALNDGSLSVSREIIFTYGSLLQRKTRVKGMMRLAWQSLLLQGFRRSATSGAC
jgi:Glycosyl transferase family 2